MPAVARPESKENWGTAGILDARDGDTGKKVILGRNGRLQPSIKPTISVYRSRDVDTHLPRVIRSKWGFRTALREKFRGRLSGLGSFLR
jgi:hypothetical protein